MSSVAPVGTEPRVTLPSHKVCSRQGEPGSIRPSDACALQGKRVRVLGGETRPLWKRSEAPLGYLSTDYLVIMGLPITRIIKHSLPKTSLRTVRESSAPFAPTLLGHGST